MILIHIDYKDIAEKSVALRNPYEISSVPMKYQVAVETVSTRYESVGGDFLVSGPVLLW